MKTRLQQAFFNSSQGPNTEKLDFQFLQTMQVGVWAPTQKLTKSQLTIMCKLGWYNDKVILFL
ncbi:nitrogen fixation protein NifR [Staphylococcus aureus]|nr:nitrogen fixation protein NifR [Staphylococcus aureus]OZX23278.1 nitrogen fixation protein NifR [Staphylococcus aureus]PZH57482.1 nitrogen fixation protein NifR [Staphylococcus aureus]QFK15077.1 nitrogen fixation protein NifR [Staphylococcus aureus]QFK63982.1 nitrogen fixation protein NifR [Staphylococcus aureus]